MKVFPSTFVPLVFYVQRVVCMVMAVSVLRMHRQMHPLTGAWWHCHRSEHGHRLPQKDKQKEECAQAGRHIYDFSRATAQRMGERR